MAKQRLDILVHERGLAPSRELARRYILAGEVRVAGQLLDKPGMKVATDADIAVIAAAPYVSRGGEKLAAAFGVFSLNVNDQICADIGASTGGFTDCLLQHGASKIYAIDVGYGQIAAKFRDDPRVVVMERTNARSLERLPEAVTFACVDVSFISLRLILPVVKGWLWPPAQMVALIKPQFEAGREEAARGEGVIRDPAVHEHVLNDVLSAAQGEGYTVCGLLRSPLVGAKGNVEFLAWLAVGGDRSGCDIQEAVAKVLG